MRDLVPYLAAAALLAIGYLGITRDRGRREDEARGEEW